MDDPALRRALRDAGLGTPATRAATIETLLSRKYVERKSSQLHPTANGRALIAAIPIEDLLSAELTGMWEQRLAEIAAGRASRARFMDEIGAFTARLVDAFGRAEPPAVAAPADDVLGHCPVCKTPVTEGFKAYPCASGKSCSFVIFKRIAGRTISPALVGVLLGRGRSQSLKGFRSKKGKRFAATLVLDAEGKVRFEFDRAAAPAPNGDAASPAATGQAASKKKTTRASSRSGAPAASGGSPSCPVCRSGHVISGNRAWGCSRWRQACKFVVAFVHEGQRIPDDEADRLFRRGRTRLMPGFSPHGRARLVLDLAAPGNVRIELGKRATRKT
jgi:DNA topoisomerase-3